MNRSPAFFLFKNFIYIYVRQAERRKKRLPYSFSMSFPLVYRGSLAPLSKELDLPRFVENPALQYSLPSSESAYTKYKKFWKKRK